MSSDEYGPFIWRNLDLRKRMKYLLETGHLSDCSFTLFTDENDKITIRCHKFVLMCSSPVFERMFNGDFVESRNSENIVLDDVSAADFQTFIDYLYLEDKEIAVAWDVCTLQNLIYLGKKFMVDNLTNLCFSTICVYLWKFSTEEIINLYAYGHQIENQNLIRRITLYFRIDPVRFFESPAILDLRLEYFLSFISNMSILDDSISQVDLFNGIEKYCKKNGLIKEPRRSVSSKLCDYFNERKITLQSGFQSTAGNDTTGKTEEKKVLNGEKKMLPEVNKGMKKTEVEEIEALNQNQEKENKLDMEKSGVGKEAQNKEYIAKLLSFVKFEKMTPTQFCNGPALSSMLDFEIKNDIVQIKYI